ncbi:RnfABCDGE type electron transport complex subunit B [Dokdonella sp.]|uniref:RnfABCDGE type electron transport complex subunit B n=1 Tax=Dokdonella sp. TaxID=2291710 RepID=UPI0035284928
MNQSLATRLDRLLPQTQCTRCGYPACRPYADAIAEGAADIDQCPPGGQSGVDALASLLGRASRPLNPGYGLETAPAVAVIDEEVCIGCTKCIQACPVDAIVGAGKRMHTVITAECTGCELCIPPCPVDCIDMHFIQNEPLGRTAILERASVARRRFENRAVRLARAESGRAARRDSAIRADAAKAEPISRADVLEAIARGKAKRRKQIAASRKPASK